MQNIPRSIAGALIGVSLLVVAQPSGQTGESEAAGIVTLYASDDIASAFSFRFGERGARVSDGRVDLTKVQLVYNSFRAGLFAFGFVHEELVQIIDLGDLQVQPIASITDTALSYPVSIYNTLYLSGPYFAYVSATGKAVRLKQADSLLDPLPSGGLSFFEPLLGHTYVIRYRSRRNRNYDGIAKFRIIDIRPEESVTLSWARLR